MIVAATDQPRRLSAAGLRVPTSKTEADRSAAAAPDRPSIADLRIVRRPPAKAVAATERTPQQNQTAYAEAIERLRSLRDAQDPRLNKNDRLTVLIAACISEGIRTKGGILSVVSHLGFNSRHAAVLLDKSANSPQTNGLWVREGDGRYRLTT